MVEVTSYLPSRLVEGIDLPTLQFGHLLGECGLLDAPRHSQLLLYALALDPLLLNEPLQQFHSPRPLSPLLGDLAPGDAVDDDDPVGYLPAGWRNTHKLTSIVGAVHGEAGHHLVACGYLVLDEEPAVGKGGKHLGYRPLVTLAAGLLAGKQSIMVDEVGGQQLI